MRRRPLPYDTRGAWTRFVDSGAGIGLLCVILLIVLLFPSSASAVTATGAVYECWQWASYDICNVIDAGTGLCPAAFDQYAYADPATAQSIFFYYIDKFADSSAFSAEFWISEIFSPSDPTYAEYLDATYNSTCSTDVGVAALLTTNTTDGSAIAARTAYLLLLRRAQFCGPNEMPIPFHGCECMAGKNCNDLRAEGAHEGLAALMCVCAVILLLVIWGATIMVRSAWSIQAGWSSTVDKVSLQLSKNGGGSASTPTPIAVPHTYRDVLAHDMTDMASTQVGGSFRGGEYHHPSQHPRHRTPAPAGSAPPRPRPAPVTAARRFVEPGAPPSPPPPAVLSPQPIAASTSSASVADSFGSQ
jgi:hypothetical protein